jgi:hypothetical protein
MTYRRIKTITSYAEHARYLAECEDLPEDANCIPTPRDIPSPYAFSASTTVMKHGDDYVFIKETKHRHYEVYKLGMANFANLMTDDEATNRYIGKDAR